jgi:hypothetical protein
MVFAAARARWVLSAAMLLLSGSVVQTEEVQCIAPSKIAKVPEEVSRRGCPGIADYFGFDTQQVVDANPGRQACASAKLSVCLPARKEDIDPCARKYYVQSSTETCAAIAASQRYGGRL